MTTKDDKKKVKGGGVNATLTNTSFLSPAIIPSKSKVRGPQQRMTATGRNATGRNANGRNANGRNANGRNANGRNATGRNATGIRSSVGLNANGRNATGIRSSVGLNATGIRSSVGLNATGLNALDLATGIDATGIDATGIDATGIDATGIDATGIDALEKGIKDTLFEIVAKTYKLELPPPKPPRTNHLVIGMDCGDDTEKDECCKINNWMCGKLNISVLKRILNIVKEIANLLINDYIKFFEPTNMISPDPRVFAKGAVVSYIIDNFLIRMTDIQNPEVKKIINMMTSTYIMLPKDKLNGINYIAKFSQRIINESIYLKTINQYISALLKEELQKIL